MGRPRSLSCFILRFIMARKRVKVKKLKLATPPKLPKLPKNGHKGVAKIGQKFRGATPRKTHYTGTKDTAAAAAAALANKEWAPAKVTADAASIKGAKKRKAGATGARIFSLLFPRHRTDLFLPVRSRCGAHRRPSRTRRPAPDPCRACDAEAALAARRGLHHRRLGVAPAAGRARRPAPYHRTGRHAAAHGQAARDGAADEPRVSLTYQHPVFLNTTRAQSVESATPRALHVGVICVARLAGGVPPRG